jgi:hypothetical protein
MRNVWKRSSLVAAEAAHGAEQVGEAAEVAGLLDMGAAHHRREPQDLDVRIAMARDQDVEAVDHALEHGGAREDAVDPGRMEQRLGRQLERIADHKVHRLTPRRLFTPSAAVRSRSAQLSL